VDAARLIAAVVALTLLSSPRPLDFAGADERFGSVVLRADRVIDP